VLIVTGGRLADIFGRKRMLLRRRAASLRRVSLPDDVLETPDADFAARD